MSTKLTFDLNTPLFKLTAGELLDLMKRGVQPVEVLMNTTTAPDKYVYGLAGIAELFGCSKTQAGRIKKTGKIDDAITQIGNLIVVDAEKALKLAGKSRKK